MQFLDFLHLCVHQVWIQSSRTSKLAEDSFGSISWKTKGGKWQAGPGPACKVSVNIHTLFLNVNEKLIVDFRQTDREALFKTVRRFSGNKCLLSLAQAQLWVHVELPQHSTESQHSFVSLPASVHCVRERRKPYCLQRADGSVMGLISFLLSRFFSIFFGALLIFNLFSLPIKTFPESGLGDGQRRKGAREQIQWSTSQSP